MRALRDRELKMKEFVNEIELTWAIILNSQACWGRRHKLGSVRAPADFALGLQCASGGTERELTELLKMYTDDSTGEV